MSSTSCKFFIKFFSSCWFIKRIGDRILLGAHDVENCQQSEGCLEVQISEVYSHEHYRGSSFAHDITLVK